MSATRNPLRALAGFGQSPWLDFISRDLLASGQLERLIEDDGIMGVTSNPSIFEQAIAGGTAYQAELPALRASGASPARIFEQLAVADVRRAADLLAPVYARSARRDGYVSLEVSPLLAHDTAGTLAEATRLWQAVARPNLMIKVPGTAAGMPAITALIAQGINVNVTLLFSRQSYAAAAEAWLNGITRRHAAGLPLAAVASVASFFVSRIDTRIDALLEARGRAELCGRAALANARLAYRDFDALLASRRWRELAAAGAQPQRLLWASTSTKSPRYRDVVYVEELIGAHTVNTLPLATLQAFRDHGRLRASLSEDPAGAEATLHALTAAGIDFAGVTDALLAEGVAAFAEAYAGVLRAVAGSAR